MVVIAFAIESMSRALMFSGISTARGEGAKVVQQGPAAQAEFGMNLVAVQASAGVHQAAQAVH